ncbi:accessory gland-specific peptide 26Ab [Drosophila ficusphila]|uniref:accessory gland-specific peptide 26Ab n=1 Tax=Drosophila ficusphila TaxID=30025 RepID=UPI0007E5F664|nr:accessory gland-specific peptide 26Ab [Drosophila ficusphila]
MKIIVLLSVFSIICLWHSTESAPYISISSSSRSRSQKMVNGHLKTVYDYNVQKNISNISGKMLRTRLAEVKSDLMSPEDLQKWQNKMTNEEK